MTKLTPILPKRNPFGTKADYDRAINNAQDLLADDIKLQFEATQSTWKHKSVFRATKRGYDREIKATGPNAKIYGYVDLGTRAHIIRPRRARRLAFASKFSPKTRVGSLTSSAGARGPVDTFRQVVAHPGTKARDFSGRIAKKSKALAAAYMRRELAKVNR